MSGQMSIAALGRWVLRDLAAVFVGVCVCGE